MERYCGVYCIKNIINGKMYIGSSYDILERWKQHKRLLRQHKHHSQYLQNAWDKYGEENFEFAIIEECEENKRVDREQYYMDYYEIYERIYGYNMSKSAQIPIMSEENKKYGEDAYQCINSEEDIKKCIELLLTGEYSYKQISDITGVSYTTVSALPYGKNWRKLTRDIDFPTPKKSTRDNVKLNEDDVSEIISLIINGKTNKEIAQKYKVHPKTISDIRNHKSWNDLTKNIDFIRSPRRSSLTSLQEKIIEFKNKFPNKPYYEIADAIGCSTSMVGTTLKKFLYND